MYLDIRKTSEKKHDDKKSRFKKKNTSPNNISYWEIRTWTVLCRETRIKAHELQELVKIATETM